MYECIKRSCKRQVEVSGQFCSICAQTIHLHHCEMQNCDHVVNTKGDFCPTCLPKVQQLLIAAKGGGGGVNPTAAAVGHHHDQVDLIPKKPGGVTAAAGGGGGGGGGGDDLLDVVGKKKNFDDQVWYPPKRAQPLPLRSPVLKGHPHCPHACCQEKFEKFSKLPVESQEAEKKKWGKDFWMGPKGVASIIFTFNPIGWPENRIHKVGGNENVNKGVINKDTPIWFLLGYDSARKKLSICSGTMSDSFARDEGCAVLAAIRECREEFKLHLHMTEWFEILTTYFWTGANVSFGLNLDRLSNRAYSEAEPGDRRDISYLSKLLDDALHNPATPGCEKEIKKLTWFETRLGADLVGGKEKELAEMTPYAKQFMQQVCQNILEQHHR